MNRKLKFRSWNLEDKNWENSAYLELDGNYELKNIMLWKYPEKYIIQQFTGLKDKNGREIYEGDIVSFSGNLTADDSCGLEPNGFFYDENSIHSIIWNEKLAGWDLNFDENDIIKYKRDTRGLLLDGSCEIIGNIFENPELLT